MNLATLLLASFIPWVLFISLTEAVDFDYRQKGKSKAGLSSSVASQPRADPWINMENTGSIDHIRTSSNCSPTVKTSPLDPMHEGMDDDNPRILAGTVLESMSSSIVEVKKDADLTTDAAAMKMDVDSTTDAPPMKTYIDPPMDNGKAAAMKMDIDSTTDAAPMKTDADFYSNAKKDSVHSSGACSNTFQANSQATSRWWTDFYSWAMKLFGTTNMSDIKLSVKSLNEHNIYLKNENRNLQKKHLGYNEAIKNQLSLLRHRKSRLENALNELAFTRPKLGVFRQEIANHRNIIGNATVVLKNMMDDQLDRREVAFVPVDIEDVDSFSKRTLFGQLFYAWRNVAHNIKECGTAEDKANCFVQVSKNVDQLAKYFELIKEAAKCAMRVRYEVN